MRLGCDGVPDVDVTNELKEDEMNKFDEYIHMDKEKLIVV